MQDQHTGEITPITEVQHRRILAEKEAKGRVGWRVGEEFFLAKASVVVTAIDPKNRALRVALKGSNTAPSLGAVYSVKGMDFKVVARDNKTMNYVLEFVKKSAGMAAMMARLAANEAPK